MPNAVNFFAPGLISTRASRDVHQSINRLTRSQQSFRSAQIFKNRIVTFFKSPPWRKRTTLEECDRSNQIALLSSSTVSKAPFGPQVPELVIVDVLMPWLRPVSRNRLYQILVQGLFMRASLFISQPQNRLFNTSFERKSQAGKYCLICEHERLS